ncbi:pyridoxamine 5'-phosphate oxidase family protein [Bifidobacterium longum]|nr:pyridoxamine 5'-phosphate oxidase family protein [Bifidobacterium longum]
MGVGCVTGVWLVRDRGMASPSRQKPDESCAKVRLLTANIRASRVRNRYSGKSKDTLSVAIMKGFDMAVITPEIKEFIKNNLGWITTVSKDGELDLGPKMSLFVLDDTHIAYHERTAGQHYENLKNGSPLVIAFANLEKKQGYRFRGNVVLHVDDDIYNEQVKVAEEKGTKKPAVIPVLEVTEIQNLASGPTAGKTIAKD